MKMTLHQRIDKILRRKKNTRWKCWPRTIKSYLNKQERANCRMLYAKFGVKYWNEKKTLRVRHNIPWGVEFDVHNPAACPQAGKWNGPLEMFIEVWKESTPRERADFIETYDPLKRN
jgi:hypothetical protein